MFYTEFSCVCFVIRICFNQPNNSPLVTVCIPVCCKSASFRFQKCLFYRLKQALLQCKTYGFAKQRF